MHGMGACSGCYLRRLEDIVHEEDGVLCPSRKNRGIIGVIDTNDGLKASVLTERRDNRNNI